MDMLERIKLNIYFIEDIFIKNLILFNKAYGDYKEIFFDYLDCFWGDDDNK